MTIDETELNVVKPSDKNTIEEKAHPWRIYSIGQHYVRAHLEHIPPSKKHPHGQVITRHAHCASNPSHKDVLSFDEIQAISIKYFENLPGPPTPNILTEYAHADDFDRLIRGWVHYWNDMIGGDNPLDPNYLKSLIATESGFHSRTDNKINKKIHAHGLMQITDQTWKILNNHNGELSNHLISLTKENLYDPSANICAGVRWLFRKRITASSTLGRPATWEEVVIDYKGYWDDMHHGRLPSGIKKLREYYQRLQQG